MDWFLYDNGLRHERVKCYLEGFICTDLLCLDFLSHNLRFPNVLFLLYSQI